MECTKLIAMQKNLGLGHKGDILLTTQKRVDDNIEAIAKDIIDEEYAKELVWRWNAFEKDGLVDELTIACAKGLGAMEAVFNFAKNSGMDIKNETKLKADIDIIKAAIARART